MSIAPKYISFLTLILAFLSAPLFAGKTAAELAAEAAHKSAAQLAAEKAQHVQSRHPAHIAADAAVREAEAAVREAEAQTGAAAASEAARLVKQRRKTPVYEFGRQGTKRPASDSSPRAAAAAAAAAAASTVATQTATPLLPTREIIRRSKIFSKPISSRHRHLMPQISHAPGQQAQKHALSPAAQAVAAAAAADED